MKNNNTHRGEADDCTTLLKGATITISSSMNFDHEFINLSFETNMHDVKVPFWSYMKINVR